MLISAPVREHYHRHPYGSCRVIGNQGTDYVFVNIPKNASSWMIRAFGRGRKCNFLHHISDRPRHYLAVLRDPVDRWISGFAQAQVGTVPWHESYYRQLGWDTVFSQVVFDNHTEPQVSFLSGLDTDDVTWFRFGPNLADDLADWSLTHGMGLDLRPREFGQDNDHNIAELSTRPVFRNPRYPHEEISGETLWEIQAHAHDAIMSSKHYLETLNHFYRQDWGLNDLVTFYRKELQ